MSAASSTVRQVFTASQHAVARKTRRAAAGRRPMSAAAMTLPQEDHAAMDLHIFDIFDAPSRLGESSKMLARAAASRAERTIRQSADSSASTRPTVQPLPAPVTYDGPARPSSYAYAPRIRQIHSQAPTVSEARDSVSALPPPEVFDGPSRLRPYLRDSAGDSVSSFIR